MRPAGPPARAGETESGKQRLLKRLAGLPTSIALAVLIALGLVLGLGRLLDTPSAERPPEEASGRAPGPGGEPAQATTRDLSTIHLLSRELRSHPTKPGMLRLTATIFNSSGQAQPHPDLDIKLLDPAGNAIVERLLSPSEYLGVDLEPGSKLASQAHLSLVVDLEDPGDQAVGFEIEFH